MAERGQLLLCRRASLDKCLQRYNMPSAPNSTAAAAAAAAAVMLAALLLGAAGVPLSTGPTDGPADYYSGEEQEVTSDLLSTSPLWGAIIGTTARHQKEFEEEFHKQVNYHSLDHFRVSSLPADCPKFNFSKDACLHRLADGLHTYMVLFKLVEKEYPDSSILLDTKNHASLLLRLIKDKMRNPDHVTAPTHSQEQQLLQEAHSPDAYHRKMTAHSILRQLHDFLRNGKVAIRRRERPREQRRKPSMVVTAPHTPHPTTRSH